MKTLTKDKDIFFKHYCKDSDDRWKTEIHIFDVYMADLPILDDYRDKHIQQYRRPCVIISNDKCNTSSPNVSVIPITSQAKKILPTHVILNAAWSKENDMCNEYGLYKPSILLVESTTSLSKERLLWKMGKISNPYIMRAIYRALNIQFGQLPL